MLAGCPDRTIAKDPPVEVGESQKDIQISEDIDLLFVIDNSASTTDKQALFTQNFPRFVDALDAFPQGRPNLHIGVVNTTVNIEQGAIGGCPVPDPSDNGLLQPGGTFLEDIASPTGRQTNYTGSLADAFSARATVGATGCGYEAPLNAMKRALDGTDPQNAGFLRDNAFLGIVILTDEDDCSAQDPSLFTVSEAQAGPADFRCTEFAYTCDEPISPSHDGTYHDCVPRTDSYLAPPADFASFLSTLKPPGRTVVSLIAGDRATDISTGPLTVPGTGQTQALALQPSCMTTIGKDTAIARPPIRLGDFLDRFADHGLFERICQSSYEQALVDIGNLIFTSVSPCLEGALDTTDQDPANPGTQLDCTVSEVITTVTDESETSIPRCPMADDTTPAANAPSPCWWVKQDTAACVTDTGYELEISPANRTPDPNSSLRVRCATTP
ncbi:MAG TPA: hypothetical protein VGM88_13705 [Kofleriaceae bacterium]